MKLDQMRYWKWFGWATLLVMLAVPVVMVTQGTSQPSAPPQTESSMSSQDDEPNQWEIDEEDVMVMAIGEEELDLAEDEEMEFFTLLLDQEPMMEEGNAEEKKIAKQNRLLLLINQLGFTKEQLQQLKNITADLKKEKEAHHAALAKQQKEINDFLLKFQGTEEDLQKGLQELRKGGQDLKKAHHEKLVAAEKQVKQMLSFAQGEKFMKAIRGSARSPRVMALRRPMMNMMRPSPGPQTFSFHHGQRAQHEIIQEFRHRLQQMQPQQGNQPPMMRQPRQQKRGPMAQMQQGRQTQSLQIGAIGHFLMRHLDVLDEVLSAKLAALRS